MEQAHYLLFISLTSHFLCQAVRIKLNVSTRHLNCQLGGSHPSLNGPASMDRVVIATSLTAVFTWALHMTFKKAVNLHNAQASSMIMKFAFVCVPCVISANLA